MAPHTAVQGHWRNTCARTPGKNPTNVQSAAEDLLSRQTGSGKSSNRKPPCPVSTFPVNANRKASCDKEKCYKEKTNLKMTRKSNKNILHNLVDF